ncbi:hypothetical protein [Atlantibacter subterraneus]|uniref:hypothetical protein n=1 Tax=Atlantibacter subterraneus TaxID=255519 RepID=UPI00289C8B73|nr:hypothetical protein [Atlantibacter subterranea]
MSAINERVSPEALEKIIEAADEVITALTGTNEDVHKDDSTKMCQLWDDLNDRHATPAIVKAMARELQQYRAAAKPVCYALTNSEGEVYNTHSSPENAEAYMMLIHQSDDTLTLRVTPLYAAPQVTSVQPFELFWSEFKHPFAEDDELKSFASEIWSACCGAAPAVQAEQLSGNDEHVSHPYTLPDDKQRLDWLDAQNKRLNEYYGTSYGWKFDANFQRNAMMLNDSNYPVMTVRQAIDEAIAAAPKQEAQEVKK